MSLRHRHKSRSWHWMRRELPFWNPTLGTFGRIFDEMAETHRRSMEDAMRSLLVESMSSEPYYGSGLGKSIFNWNPVIGEPLRGYYDKIWFDEAADFPPIAFDMIQKRINDRAVSISSNAELHFDGMTLPITDLRFHTK